jgi:DNA-binding beta-propeller fold protein YncE/mono/diheme cytochrome c family protein
VRVVCRHLRIRGLPLLGAVGALMFSLQPAADDAPGRAASTSGVLAPSAIVASPDGATWFIACEATPAILALDPVDSSVRTRVALPAVPSGLALSPDGERLYVTTRAPGAACLELAVPSLDLKRSFPLPHTATSPAVAPAGRSVWVGQRFLDQVIELDLATGREMRRVAVTREPVSLAFTPEGRHLLVAGHLPDGSATGYPVAARVSVVEAASGRRVKDIDLPNGSTLARDLRVSPDGRFAAVAHGLARYHVPTTQADRGWILGNAISLLDLATLERLNTVLLDSIDRGAANPWGVAWSADGQHLLVTHAGTHELSVIRAPALLDKLRQLPAVAPTNAAPADAVGARWTGEVPDDLAFLVGLRQRVPLQGRGPRGLAVTGADWVATGFFSDTVERGSFADPTARPALTRLGTSDRPSLARRGEEWFNDARLAFQGWQSCASCHSDDARVDGLNWDLLNDGLGNPKNSKSLLLSHRTPPAMSLGVRDTAEVAVRAGLRHILFTVQPETVPAAMDTWLRGLRPAASPHLVEGRLSPAARRGRAIFEQRRVGCARCHLAGLFTDQNPHDVGTSAAGDPPGTALDTPTLIELWRTRPYLHDGSAATLREVLVERNPRDQHGRTSHLTPAQLDDLVAYLLSL